VLHFEFIDEAPKDFPKDLTFESTERIDTLRPTISFEGKNRYISEVDGYHISLNKLGEFFGDFEERFQKKLFIPHTSIKMVREEYEYKVDKQDVFDLIEDNHNEGIFIIFS